MRKCPTFLLAAVFVSLSPVMSFGQAFKFESQHQEVKATIRDTELSIRFPFTHQGEGPVEISGIESTCGCIKASTDRTVYEPGMKGEVEALFSLGTFVGTHQKLVYLDTKDPDGQRYRLTVTVEIPEVVSIEPKVARWQIGAEAEPQVLDIRFLGEEKMSLVDIQSTRPQFQTETETVEEGHHYRVTVTPTSTDQPTMGALKIVTDSEIPKYQRAMAFCMVSRTRAGASESSDAKPPAELGAAKPE